MNGADGRAVDADADGMVNKGCAYVCVHANCKEIDVNVSICVCKLCGMCILNVFMLMSAWKERGRSMLLSTLLEGRIEMTNEQCINGNHTSPHHVVNHDIMTHIPATHTHAHVRTCMSCHRDSGRHAHR